MGPVTRFEDEVGRGAHAWPLYNVEYTRQGRKTDILWPLLAFNNMLGFKYYAFRPFAMVTTDRDDTLKRLDVLYPFFHTGKRGTRDEFAIRPLWGMWRDPENELTDIDFLFPFGYYRSEPGKKWFLFRPVFWYKDVGRKGYFHIFPLFGTNFKRTGPDESKDQPAVYARAYWFLTPFFSYRLKRKEEQTEWSVNAVAPLSHFEGGTDDTQSWVFPFYYRGTWPDAHLFAVTPLYWDFEKRSLEDPGKVIDKTQLFLPFYGYSRTGDSLWRSFGGNLLILEDDEDGGSVNVLWPVFHHGWSDDRTLSWLYPLYSYYSKDDWTCYSTCFPFFLYGTDGASKRNIIFGGPLFHHWYGGEDDWSWNLLFPLVNVSQRNAQHHSRFFPFYLWWDNDTTRYLHLLWPLVRNRTTADTTDFRFLFPYITYRSDKNSYDFRLFWKWIQASADEHTGTFIFNPFYAQEEGIDGDLSWSILGGLVSRTKRSGNADWTILWFIPL